MKNIIFLLASISFMMLTGCGDGTTIDGTTSAPAQQSSSVPAPQEVGSLPSVPSIPQG